jgi:hypothetical protein
MSRTATHAEPIERSPLEEAVFGAMAGKVVAAAAEMGIADLLAEGPRTSAEIAEQTRAHRPSLRRLLRALAGLGVLVQTDRDRFHLTDLGRSLQTDAPNSIRALVTMLCSPELWRSWGELMPSVCSGERAFERANRISLFEFYERNPEASATFNTAMAQHSRDAAAAIIPAANLSRFDTVMDVGGGDGTLIAEILRAHRHLEGVLFDLPQGLESAARTLAAAGVADRCRTVGGDVFEGVPAGADAYLLKQVLHDWDDAQAGAILRSVRGAMTPDARLLILERMLPETVTAADTQTLLLDVLMLLVTGGKERTEQEFRSLLSEAGFRLATSTEPIPPFDYRVIEATPINGRCD